jgi:hypothetical protein
MTAQPAKPDSPGIGLTQTQDPPPCPRCGGEGLLSAQVPQWRNGQGADVRGAREVVLCPHCDAHDPAAGPLIRFFAVHGQVTAGTTEELASLLRSWADHAQLAAMNNDAALEAELAAWQRGELDADEPLPPGSGLPGDNRLEWPDGDPDDWQ